MKFPILLMGFLLFQSLNAQVYCSSSGSISNFEWIEKVQLTNIFHTSGNNDGYADFTNFTANVFRGAPVTLWLTPGISENNSTPNEYWKVWIDFNHDGDFTDPNELIFSSNGTTSVQQQAIVEIPYAATPGVTRMRVTMKFVNEENLEPTPCDDFLYGEVEDYSINIQTPPTGDSVSPIDASVAYFNSTNNSLELNKPNLFKSIKVYNLYGQLAYESDKISSQNTLPISSQLGIILLTDKNNETYYLKATMLK